MPEADEHRCAGKPACYHIAQFNVARAKADVDNRQMHGFVRELGHINELADHSPGFVWRLKTEAGHAIEIRPYEDRLILVTLSVWETIDDLFTFSYRGEHAHLLRQRKQWFSEVEGSYIVLWWIPAGAIPTVEEGKQKLQLLRRQGPSATAFTFSERYPLPVQPIRIGVEDAAGTRGR